MLTLQRLLVIYKPLDEIKYKHYFVYLTFIGSIIFIVLQFYSFYLINFSPNVDTYVEILLLYPLEDFLYFTIPLIMKMTLFFLALLFLNVYRNTKNYSEKNVKYLFSEI